MLDFWESKSSVNFANSCFVDFADESIIYKDKRHCRLSSRNAVAGKFQSGSMERTNAERPGPSWVKMLVDDDPVADCLPMPPRWLFFLGLPNVTATSSENQRWFEYTGLTLEETQGWGWQLALHPDDAG